MIKSDAPLPSEPKSNLHELLFLEWLTKTEAEPSLNIGLADLL